MKQMINELVTEFDIKVHNKKLFSRLLLDPSMGAGESYMEAWWDCERLDELFAHIPATFAMQASKKSMGFFYPLLKSVLNMQNKLRSKKVADVHYNLGNDLYEAMLGESMAYTCGYWKQATTLDQAQYDKYELICQKVQLKQGDKVLDLGCGFGGFSKHAAKHYGCEVVSVNISQEQVHYAKEICKGLPVSVYLSDYRDEKNYNPQQQKFDKIISIGMCEHIGEKNYRPFMELVARNLKEDGLFLLHTIGNNVSLKACDPWFDKYIFPNGQIPSIQQLAKAMEGVFVVEDWHNFGADYDKTLMAWYENFKTHWPQLAAHYGQKFYRMWRYYLLSCAGAFRSRTLQLWQVVLTKNGYPHGYQSIR